MNRITAFCVAGLMLTASGTAIAEPTLTGPGGILDHLYGWDNVAEVDSSLDQLWINPGTVTISAQAAWSDWCQRIGYLPGEQGGDYEPLFRVNDSGYLGGHPSRTLSVAQTGSTFRWADDPSGAAVWSSRDADNYDGGDHMRTFEIIGGPHAGDYVIGWEDLPCLGDRDHQDVILQVGSGSPVPEPTALALLGIGGGLALRRRRR